MELLKSKGLDVWTIPLTGDGFRADGGKRAVEGDYGPVREWEAA